MVVDDDDAESDDLREGCTKIYWFEGGCFWTAKTRIQDKFIK